MPLSSSGIATSLIAGLRSSAMLGEEVPKLSQGLGNGLFAWANALTVTTIDTGSGGVGVGFIPWLVPSAILIPNLLATYTANGLLGIMAPLEATGLGNGLSLGFAQGALFTNHVGVGSGAGVARVSGPPAFSFIMAGLASVGIKGSGAAQKASAISQALAATLAVFTLPIPIVGSASPSVVAGVGTGRIV